MPEPQNYKNHGRLDPPMHFFAVPILLLNVFVWIGISIVHHRHGLPLHLWIAVVSVAVLVVAVHGRANDLKNQNRVIRVEERLRYAALLSPAELAAPSALTLKQIVALRFASDAELPALMARTLAEGLDSKAIKQSIVTWRPDYDRV